MVAGGSAWRVLAVGLGALLAAPAQGRAEVYPIDQTVASIGFEVSGLGLLPERGAFSRFHGVLSLDTTHPEATTIVVTIAADSAAMGWGVATAALLSPAFFDAVHHPLMRFASRRVERISPALYRITGTLEIHGIVRPLRLRARLVHGDTAPGSADFVVTGEISRSSFGMVADRPLVSDLVRLTIDAHIHLPGGVYRRH